MAKDKLPKGLEESQLNETQNPETSQCDGPLYDTLALSPEELAMIEEYRKLGEGLRPVEGGEFICIEDKEYSGINYDKTYVSKRTNRDEFERRKRSVGCIGYNNGVMTYVDGEGRQYVTVWTKEAEEALEQAGYKYEGMNIYVPFSNGERFTDEDTQAEWEYLRKKSKVERRRAEESAMIEEYRKLGEGLRPVEGGEFICIEDKEYGFISSDKTYVSKRTNRDEFERRKRSVGCIGYNNGVMTYIDGEGRQYVTVWTKEAEKALEQAGYKYEGMNIYVPFSNGEHFTDEDTQAEWEYLRNKSKVERRREEESAMIEEYRKLGEGLKPVEGGEFICIDDKKYRPFMSENEYISRRTDRKEFERRKESVGCYGYNNSVLTYIDGEGRQYVTVWTKEAEEALEQAGYKYEGMNIYVPFSNGECFTDEDTQAEWEYLRDKSKVERKRAEKK